MDQEYWTSEHANQIDKRIDEATRILCSLERAQLEHEKGGVYFNTTKRLLESYRMLRFDAISEKMLKTAESIGASDENPYVTLDHILSMPEVYNYYTKEVSMFMKSSIPITMGLLIHVIDTGIRVLAFTERKKVSDLKYSDILKAVYIDEEKDTKTLVEELNTKWATFHRKKNEAITALSIIIFGPLGCRHPSSLFDDNKLMQKYSTFVEVADKIDLFAELANVTEKYEK